MDATSFTVHGADVSASRETQRRRWLRTFDILRAAEPVIALRAARARSAP